MGDNADPRGTRRGRPAAPSSAVLTPPTGLPSVPSTPEAPAKPAVPAQRDPEDTRPPVLPPVVVEPCTCGHPKAAHEHYRRGSDCGACGAESCGEFRPVGGPVRQTLRRWGLTH